MKSRVCSFVPFYLGLYVLCQMTRKEGPVMGRHLRSRFSDSEAGVRWRQNEEGWMV